MAKVIIDANVIVSAAFGGIPLRAVTKALKDDEVCVSTSIEQELSGVFPRLSRKLTKEQLTFLKERVEDLMKLAKLVSVTAAVKLSRDATDDHYLSLCKEVEPDFLVTRDKDLLTIRLAKLKEKGISCRILTPQEFIEESERDY